VAADSLGVRAVELLIDEAWEAIEDSRYLQALAAAQRAVHGAEELDDPELLVRGLVAEAAPLRMLGDAKAALARYTRVLSMAEDRSTSSRLGSSDATWAVGRAYVDWVECALDVPGIATRDLFGVLDAAERWLATTGHQDWRAGILTQRAEVHNRLGESDAAIAAAEESLAVHQLDAPGYTLSSHRFQLGHLLCEAGRYREAEPLFQAVLDDPEAPAYERCRAYRGLAWCAVDAGDPGAALRHATAAVRLAESLGDAALSLVLDALVDAALAAEDLDAAWRTATRWLEAAGRVGGHTRPYYATRSALVVAIERGDVETAERLLADLDRYAAIMDGATGGTDYRGEADELRGRLAELTTPETEGEV
jgi:hypothetical protein